MKSSLVFISLAAGCALFLLAGCFAGIGGLENGPKTPQPSPDSSEGSDATVADVPVSVSGAFLACGWDSSTNTNQAVVGCALRGAEGEKIDFSRLSVKPVWNAFQRGTNSLAAVQQQDAPLRSRWHELFTMPIATVTNITIHAGILSGSHLTSKTFDAPLQDQLYQGKSAAQVQDVVADIVGPIAANPNGGSGASTTLQTQGYYRYHTTEQTVALRASDICSPDGVKPDFDPSIKSALNQMAQQIAASDPGFNAQGQSFLTSLQAGERLDFSNSDACFLPFAFANDASDRSDMLAVDGLDTGTDWVRAGPSRTDGTAACFFVLVQETVPSWNVTGQMIQRPILQIVANPGGDLSVDSLKRMAQTYRCQ